MSDVLLKKCRLCKRQYNILNRECPKCGCQNEEFFNMPEASRDAFVEFYHDRDIFISMEAQAIKEGVSVEELYQKAAETYLDGLVKRS